MPDAEDRPAGYYRRLAWTNRYMMDWFDCGPEVTELRAMITIMRWFTVVNTRKRMLEVALKYVQPGNRIKSPQLRLNLIDLLENSTEIDLGIPLEPFAIFCASLRDGDIIDGGPTIGREVQPLIDILPGFAYMWSKWRLVFGEFPMPWPFWIWPHPVQLVLA
ncbi:MAG: hypothetical protein ACYTAO_02415 [Planctomycetota bacterium]|jgi:hypothetical protein